MYTPQTKLVVVRSNSGVKRIFDWLKRDQYLPHLEIIDRFMVEWLTDEKAAKQRVLEKPEVEAEFVRGFLAIN